MATLGVLCPKCPLRCALPNMPPLKYGFGVALPLCGDSDSELPMRDRLIARAILRRISVISDGDIERRRELHCPSKTKLRRKF